jgi:hypothetical protein
LLGCRATTSLAATREPMNAGNARQIRES